MLNDTLATIPSLETQMRQGKDALCLLLGMPPNDLFDALKITSNIPVSPAQVVVGIPAELLSRRPDIRSAEYQAIAQSAQIGIAQADLYPALSLSGSFGFLSTNIGSNKLGDIAKWPSRFIQAGPGVQWNIFDLGRITNNVRAQKEVEDNLSAFLNSQERSLSLKKSATAAQKAVDLAVHQYREGTKDFTTVLTAHQALLNEQDSLALAQGNIATDLVGVYRALGGGWEVRDKTVSETPNGTQL